MANGLVVFDEVKAEVAKFKAINASMGFDYEDPQDEKYARSHVFKLRGTKGRIATVHKTAKAEALAHCKAVDAEKRWLLNEVEEMIAVHMDPINEIANEKIAVLQAKKDAEIAEAARLEQERINLMKMQEEDLARRLAEAEAKEEATRKAETVRLANIKAEEDRIANERALLEAEKQAEINAKNREAKAREQAEIDKQFAIEQAEQEKQEALAAAEQEKADAIEAEKEKARKLEAARLAQVAADKVESDRLAAAAAKKAANKKHQRRVDKDIIKQFTEITQDEDMSEAILLSIKECDYGTNLTINY